jgi:hypothetical protein
VGSDNKQIPEIQRRHRAAEGHQPDASTLHASEADPAATPAELALRFPWWLFDRPQELEAAQVEVEGKKKSRWGFDGA